MFGLDIGGLNILITLVKFSQFTAFVSSPAIGNKLTLDAAIFKYLDTDFFTT